MTKEHAKKYIPRAGYAGLAFAVLAGSGYLPMGGPLAGMCFAFAFGVYVGLEAI